MKGCILAIKNKSWKSWLIRKAIKCDYNHVGIFVDNERIVESTFKGVYITPFEVFKKKKEKGEIYDYAVFEVIGISEEQKEKVAEYALGEVGNKYDLVQFFNIALFLFLNIARIVEPIDIRHAWVCSELVAEAYDSVGIRFTEDVDPDLITPADIVCSKLVRRINA